MFDGVWGERKRARAVRAGASGASSGGGGSLWPYVVGIAVATPLAIALSRMLSSALSTHTIAPSLTFTEYARVLDRMTCDELARSLEHEMSEEVEHEAKAPPPEIERVLLVCGVSNVSRSGPVHDLRHSYIAARTPLFGGGLTAMCLELLQCDRFTSALSTIKECSVVGCTADALLASFVLARPKEATEREDTIRQVASILQGGAFCATRIVMKTAYVNVERKAVAAEDVPKTRRRTFALRGLADEVNESSCGWDTERDLMARVQSVLENVEEEKSLWEGEDAQVRTSFEMLKNGRVAVEGLSGARWSEMCLIRCVDPKLLVAEIHPLALAAKFCVEHAEDDASVLGSEGSFVCIPPGMIALAVNEARKSYRLDVVGSKLRYENVLDKLAEALTKEERAHKNHRVVWDRKLMSLRPRWLWNSSKLPDDARNAPPRSSLSVEEVRSLCIPLIVANM